MQALMLLLLYVTILVRLTNGNIRKRIPSSTLETIYSRTEDRLNLPVLPGIPTVGALEPLLLKSQSKVLSQRKKLRQRNFRTNERDTYLSTNEFDDNGRSKKNHRNRKNQREDASTKSSSTKKRLQRNKQNKKKKKYINSTRHFRSHIKNPVEVTELGFGRSIIIKTTLDQRRRNSGSLIGLSRGQLKKLDSSERLRQAQLDITVRVGSVRSKRRRRNQELSISLSLIQPREDKVPLRLATNTKSVTLRPLSIEDVDTNGSGRSRSRRIEKTFRFDMTRFVPKITEQTKNLTDSNKQLSNLSNLQHPNFLFALSCVVDRRIIPCSKYKVILTGVQRLRLETVQV